MLSTPWLSPATLLSPAKLFRRPKPSPLDISAFAPLPPELLIHIASYLPLASAAAFSLCSKALYALLAIPYLKCRRGHHSFDTTEFLKLLEPDLPDHVACYYCEKLHEIKRLKRHTNEDKRCDIRVSNTIRYNTHFTFSYTIFQMAMKRHRQGASTAALLKHLAYNEHVPPGDIRLTASPRIRNGSLLLRNQYIFIIHRGNDSSLGERMWAYICPHLKEIRGRVIFHIGGKVEYRMAYLDGTQDIDTNVSMAQCDCCDYRGRRAAGDGVSRVIKCGLCATEIRIDSVAVGKAGQAFVVTRWKDLGEGRTDDDPVWRGHLDEGGGRSGFRAAEGSICAAFEGTGKGAEELEFGSLLTVKERKRLWKFGC